MSPYTCTYTHTTMAVLEEIHDDKPVESQDSQETTKEEPQEEKKLPYTWDQTLKDVSVTIPLPAGTRAKMLDVAIGRLSISAKLKFNNPDDNALIKGELFAPIVADESTWSIVDEELSITLEKKTQEWWPHVVTTDPKIDISKIEPASSNLDDLDDETRATVEKVMWEQRQRAASGQAPSGGTPVPTMDEAGGMQGLPEGFDFPQQSQADVDPAQRAHRRRMFEKFKAMHPEMDFSKVEGTI